MDVGAVLNVTDPKKEDQGPPATSLGGPSHDASQAPSHGGLLQEWNSWLEQPGNQAALVTAGLNMMQPIGVGQSVLGHIARAVGKGGEAKQEMQQKQVSQELEKSQAEYYRSGGSHSATGALTAGQILTEQRNHRELYNKALLAVWGSDELGGDSLDPVSAMMKTRTEDPEKFNEIMAAVNVYFKQLLDGANVSNAGPTLATQIPSAPKVKIDTQGRKWKLQNNQWVQSK